MQYAVINVKPLPNYTLHLTFKSGEQKLFDMKPYLNIGIFTALQDKLLFNTAFVSFDTVEWSNKADIDPETLYQESYSIDTPNTISL